MLSTALLAGLMAAATAPFVLGAQLTQVPNYNNDATSQAQM